VRSWRLPEIETPGGSRSPVVLYSGDEGRAVLMGLEAGQELGDHQVKESAFLIVLEGTVEIEPSNGDPIAADAGTLVTFEPDERRSVGSRGGARILLLLAPWPGPGHYHPEELAGQAQD